MPALPQARDAVRALRASKIREVANAAMGAPDVLAFWFGEPDEATPEFIRRAAIEAVESGDTFYTHNLGTPELRDTLATYLSRLHRPVKRERVAVTSAGVSALMLATEALVGAGDRVVEVTPLWPNLVEQPKILGASVECVPLAFGEAGWTLDLDRLLDALTPDTRAVYINSPNNPTGWTIDRASQRAILDHCRKHGIWIVADDAYERLFYEAPRGTSGAAPSFLDIAEPDDRVLSTNTFSKSWLMTGWRLGWIVAPEALVPDLGVLIEYNTSCAPGFVQQAGVVAVRDGEPVIAHTVERFRAARDFLVARLAAIPGIDVVAPPGAMYLFFRVHGVADSLAFAKRLVMEAKLGLAPGVAFGPEGEGFLRWCFAASEQRLAEGVARLERFLQRRDT
ncbi:MAG: pyridoxal phosphate-dependent aminotransferase [Burkholderiales bacterium]|jgi:aspartate/methionine/tyrosine aminotransferase|nr:pyridoxal phosphate-dependent aminotransferase [Burkholderiales bacterium]